MDPGKWREIQHRARETLAGNDEYLFAMLYEIASMRCAVVLAQYKSCIAIVRLSLNIRDGELRPVVLTAINKAFSRDWEVEIASIRRTTIEHMHAVSLEEERRDIVPESLRQLATTGKGAR